VQTSENKTHPINLPHQQLQPNKPQKPTQNTPTTQKTTAQQTCAHKTLTTTTKLKIKQHPKKLTLN
jgi:hypothetical protein